MPQKCFVSFLDLEGIRHALEIEDAEGVYEAAARAIKTFRDNNCEPGTLANLEVEVRSSITHTVTPKLVREWIASTAKSPKQKILKDRLREMVDPEST